MKKTINTILTITLLTAAPLASASFTDIGRTHNNYVAVNHLQEIGVIQGYRDGTYHPHDMIQRAEALKIILTSQNIPAASSFTGTGFEDVSGDTWYAPYIVAAKNQNIIQNNADNTFEPARNITRAEFIKMLLIANGFTESTWGNRQIFSDVPLNAWFTPYMNYAGQAGIITKDKDNNLYPSQIMTRGEVAETIYLLYLIKNRTNNELLLSEADKHMRQLEYNLEQNNLVTAKKAAEIFVSITQQTYRNNPTDTQSLGKAKLARAYDFLINGKISKEHNNLARGEAWETLAIIKAREAKQVDTNTTATANHIENMTQ